MALDSHPHMYTPTLWEQVTVTRMSGSALEPTWGGGGGGGGGASISNEETCE